MMAPPDGFYCLRCDKLVPTPKEWPAYFAAVSNHLAKEHGETYSAGVAQ